MTINTFFSVWTFPKPTVFGFFNRFNEVFANNICSRSLLFSGMLFVHNFLKFGIIPISHVVFAIITHIHINRTFLHLIFYSQIVREFTFVTLGTETLFEEGT